MANMSPLRGYITSYPPRVRQYGNALLTPIIPPSQVGPTSRTTKRGTAAINYAEDGYDDEDFEDSEGPRRPTGLRSLRREESTFDKVPLAEKLGKEIHAPVEVQGVFRDWMIKRMLRPAYVPLNLILQAIPVYLCVLSAFAMILTWNLFSLCTVAPINCKSKRSFLLPLYLSELIWRSQRISP